MKLIKTRHDEDELIFQNFRNLTPLVFLAVNHISHGAVEKICKTFGLKEDRGKQESLVYFIDETPQRTHKEQSIYLAGAALYVANLFPVASVLLSSENRLKNSILDGMEIEGAQTKEDLVTDWIHTDAKFTVSSEIQSYLLQAGFDFVAEENDKHFTRDEVIHQLQHLLFTNKPEQVSNQKPNQKKGA